MDPLNTTVPAHSSNRPEVLITGSKTPMRAWAADQMRAQMNANITFAKDAPHGMSIIREQAFDLVVSIEDFEMLYEMRVAGRRTPSIIISANPAMPRWLRILRIDREAPIVTPGDETSLRSQIYRTLTIGSPASA